MDTEQQELVEQEDEKALVPTQHKTSDGEIMVIVGFASAVPALWLDVALNLGLPGFVVGALLVTVLALGGPAAVRRMGWAKLGLDLDWSSLFDTVSSLDAPHASIVVESTVNQQALQAALDTDLPHGTRKLDDGALPQQLDESELESLFIAPQDDNTGGIERLTIEEIVRHTKRNSYNIWIGRSLTKVKEGYPAVMMNIYKKHFKFIGSSQKGKSSMVAALLDIITQTHDKQHVLLALLDHENRTSKLFAHLPHVAKISVEGKGGPFPLHATTKEQVVEYLAYIVAFMEYRLTLDTLEILNGPILLVYIEEFLRLKNWLRNRMRNAVGEEAKAKAQAMYESFVESIRAIALQGLKTRIQLVLCAQVDYADDDKDLKEALLSVDNGLSFCVRPSAAKATGFYQHELLNRNAAENKVGQAVVETTDCKDLVLAPSYDLEQRLLEWETVQREAEMEAERQRQREAASKPFMLRTRGDQTTDDLSGANHVATERLASNVRPLRPLQDRAQPSNVARNEAQRNTASQAQNEDAGKSDCAQKNALRQPVDTAQWAQNDAIRYRLSDEQITQFFALWPDHIKDKDEALRKVGGHSGHRAHINEIIRQREQMREAR